METGCGHNFGVEGLFNDLQDDFHDLGGGEEAYIPMLPQVYSEEAPEEAKAMSPWPPKLPLELALGAEKEEDIILRYNIPPERYLLFKQLPAFRRDLADAQKVVREQGLTFKLKCATMAEEFLEEIYLDIFDSRVGLGTKHDIFKTVTRLAELEPKESKAVEQGLHAPTVNIQINL